MNKTPNSPVEFSPAVKPIRGTWLNLFDQDTRNKYTNPAGLDLAAPELWRLKIKEMAEAGIEYLIFVAVANEGKAMYASDFMPPAYRVGREEPVEAIMRAADEHGLKVFMSCGWGANQDEGVSDSGTRDRQFRIMAETARKFGRRPSFHGWYLPCEFPVAPCFTDRAIDSVNVMAVEARRLTPRAKILISPYFMHAAVVDDKFVAQLARLDVDIVAYQDGVGCLFAHSVERQFAGLRWAHAQIPHIALWANVESFAWETGRSNSRQDALVPAAFPRLLRQMTDASPHVDETISFIVQGMFDKPDSPMPLGQPGASAQLAAAYADFLAGKGRWPLLAASFAGRLTHAAIGKPVELAAPPTPFRHNGYRCANGLFAGQEVMDPQWLRFKQTDLNAVIDLELSISIHALAIRFFHFAEMGIRGPERVEFAVSGDGRDFKPVAAIVPEVWPNERLDCWMDMAAAFDLKQQGRYIRVRAANAGQWLFVDQLMVNPEVECALNP